MTEQSPGRDLQTLKTAFRILEAIQELDGGRVTEVAQHLDMAESTAHGYLSTLHSEGYLVREGDTFQISLEFLNLGGYAQQRLKGSARIENKVRELAEQTGERAQFFVEEHGIATYVYTETGEQAVQVNARLGKQTHLHSSAGGKAILAHLPEQRIQQIIQQHGLPARTENTITNEDTLYEELESVREQGFSINRQESTEGLRAVGVPVKRNSGAILGALSISGPSNRLQGEVFEEEIPSLLKGAANELELRIHYE